MKTTKTTKTTKHTKAAAGTATVETKQVAWTPVGGAGQGPGGGRAAPETVTLNRAREELGLDFTLFELALQLGEIRTVSRGSGQWRVPVDEVTRLRDAEGHPQALLDRLRLVTSTEGAAMIGISRDRLVRLARLGLIRPVRWYVNRYRALVWVYLGHELREFAAASPAMLKGRLPAGLREALDAGQDQRALGWRSRRVAQLVRDCHDAWDEAAVWAALLGPEVTDDAVPAPFDRARLRGIRAALPPGRPGPLASPELTRSLTTADHPDEIALALVALADALGRARTEQPAPHPAFAPADRLPLALALTERVPQPPERLPEPGPVPGPKPDPSPTAIPGLGAILDLGARPNFGPISGPEPEPEPEPMSRPVPGEPAGPHSAERPAPVRPRHAAPHRKRGTARPPGRPVGEGRRPRRGLLGLLRGRRSAADLAEQPFLHHRYQQTPPPVEDLSPRQTAGTGRDG
ncbi:DUF6397 family protein [Streptomyces sp. CBMA29]|uniref:DUF6397 family protein n=1 Tax=Streptomyces sp. CBMA29 TaxID=1896314 RepID=UPI001661FEB1|nr:DUF6397 family protein [Streptomyces sp. CBMA29]